MKKLSSLPQPDAFGNYWFKSDKEEYAPAILLSNKAPMLYGRPQYFVSLGEDGLVWDGNRRLKFFDDPQEALWELQRRLNL